jgi:outer membrane protein OmpA-like peptidoglycan-associated protein
MARRFQGRSAASLRCKKAAIALASSLGALAAVASQDGVLAQQTVFVGQHAQADVIVDLSAIDQAIKNQGKPGSNSANAAASTERPSVALTPPKLRQASAPSGEAPIVLHPPGLDSAKNTALANGSSGENATAAKAPASDFASFLPIKPTTPQKAATQNPPAASGPTGSSPSPSASSKAGAAAAGAVNSATASATAPQQPTSPVSAAPQAPAAAKAPLVADQTPPPPTAAVPAAQVASNPATASASKSGSESASHGEPALSINFGAGGADLPDNARDDLDRLATTLQQSSASRVQLLAYAAGSDGQASQVRRLSLDRALAVRKYLLDQGIAASRIEVRALGNKVEGDGSPDRVDLLVLDK